MAQIDLKNATIKLKDGTSPTPNELSINIGEGELTFTETKNREYTLNRGALDGVRDGDEAPVDVSLDFIWEYLKGPTSASTGISGGIPTPEDCFKQRGGAVNWVSSDTDDVCQPYAVDIEIDYQPDCVTGDREIITLSDFRWESMPHALKAGTVSVTGKCNITEASIVRSAHST